MNKFFIEIIGKLQSDEVVVVAVGVVGIISVVNMYFTNKQSNVSTQVAEEEV